MAEDTTASVIPLHQVPPKRKARTSAQRSKPRSPRKPRKAKAAPADDDALGSETLGPDSETLIPPEFLSTDLVVAEPVAAPPPPVALQAVEPLSEPAPPSPRRQLFAPVLLSIAALALAGVGITMNGWFARSLGSSDIAGWLFLAVGVAADVVALVMPACGAGLWHAGHRATALVGWAVWVMTFVFALTAGIGFASTNISDTTLARASRTTPAVAVAQAALGDAMAARDRECKGGVGKFCREREAAVAERRQAVDTAMHAVEQTADPQTDAAIRVVAWVSRGALQPTSNDFAMLRLVLLALLPQIGGILLMVGRRA
ncbi:hypothetical protein [Bradyrhizobium sp.]|jgi:hypothetical protein|uniref:hypothetical protein n=1 Tax=Bradyrhizobium sp. TaxID=376 RepID=UPI002BEBFE81|nr:hypothetical protein [Bradyrhizobium sp.]HWX58291.1 hypothetical protein [Bradyrhizobium sp.]